MLKKVFMLAALSAAACSTTPKEAPDYDKEFLSKLGQFSTFTQIRPDGTTKTNIKGTIKNNGRNIELMAGSTSDKYQFLKAVSAVEAHCDSDKYPNHAFKFEDENTLLFKQTNLPDWYDDKLKLSK